MDAVAAPAPAESTVEAALADLDKALKGLQWSAEFSRLSGDPAAESLTALSQVLAGMAALMRARQAERMEIAAAIEAEAGLVVRRANAELEASGAKVVERLGPVLVKTVERQMALRLWSVRLKTVLLSGAVALGLAIAVAAISYASGFGSGRSEGLVAGHVIAGAMSAGPRAAEAWSQLMAANDPVAALRACKPERDSAGRRFCHVPMWLDPPAPAGR